MGIPREKMIHSHDTDDVGHEEELVPLLANILDGGQGKDGLRNSRQQTHPDPCFFEHCPADKRIVDKASISHALNRSAYPSRTTLTKQRREVVRTKKKLNRRTIPTSESRSQAT